MVLLLILLLMLLGLAIAMANPIRAEERLEPIPIAVECEFPPVTLETRVLQRINEKPRGLPARVAPA